jgi:hypothetical protein
MFNNIFIFNKLSHLRFQFILCLKPIVLAVAIQTGGTKVQKIIWQFGNKIHSTGPFFALAKPNSPLA